MTPTHRWTTLIAQAVKIAEKKAPVNTARFGVNDRLISSALNKKLISTDKLSGADLPQFISTALAQKAELVIVNQTDLDAHESWLHDPAHGLVKKGGALNQLVALDLSQYRSMLVLGNCFGSTRPDLTLKLKTVEYLIQLGKAIGLAQPKIAVLAAVEVVYPQMAVTRDGAVLAKMSDRGQIKGGLVDGPLSFDVAIDPEVALSKGVKNSTVAGKAEGLLTPDSQTGRGIWEAQIKFSGARCGSIILGGALPIIGVGALDNPESVLNSVALAHLLG